MSNETIVWQRDDGVVTIIVRGAFNASTVTLFRPIIAEIDDHDTALVIDLGEAEYIDSAALGLMIHLKKKLKDSNVNSFSIINSNARILKVLQTMHFGDMYTIDMLNNL